MFWSSPNSDIFNRSIWVLLALHPTNIPSPSTQRKYGFDLQNKDWLTEANKFSSFFSLAHANVWLNFKFRIARREKNNDLEKPLGCWNMMHINNLQNRMIVTQCKNWNLKLLWLTVHMNKWFGKIVTDVYLDQIKSPCSHTENMYMLVLHSYKSLKQE